jgi:aminotransferase EvaB
VFLRELEATKMKSLNDLHRIEPQLLQAIQEAVRGTVESGWFVLGKNVTEFEEKFAAYTGVASCVSVANGTDALEIALRSLGIGPGSTVASAANAGFYSSTAILSCGAEPCYIDVDLDSSTMSVGHLAQSMEQTKPDAVIVTHLYGSLARIEEIRVLCDKHGVPLIEDCAQSHGASRNCQKAGSFGDLSCFSFYPTKNLGAMGDGGAVCTSNEELVNRVKAIRQYGWKQKYHVVERGGRNSRLDEIQACILSLKLAYLDDWNTKRRKIAKRFNEGINNNRVIRKPTINDDAYVAHLYVLQVEDRDSLMRHLKAHSIPHDIHYPVPDYRQQVYLQERGKSNAIALKNTEELSRTILTLPCFPGMTDQEIDLVVSCVNAWSN